MGKSRNYCDLCHVKNKAWIQGNFFGIASCRNHPRQPLIVLTEHRAELTEKEKKEMEELAQEKWPGYKPRRKGMGSLPEHFHEHYVWS